MRRIATLLFFLPLIASCKKEDDIVASNTAEYAEVPNWQNRAMLADFPGGGFDTVYAYNQNEFTYIRYQGIPYRVRAQKGLDKYVVSDTGRAFYVTVFDGKDRPIMDCFVRPGMYQQDGRIILQPQVFSPLQVAPFVNGRTGDYYSR